MLRRQGNKKDIRKHIIQHFPAHHSYIEPFFGTGSVFFGKKPAKKNYLNDIDLDVYNYYTVVQNEKESLLQLLNNFIYHRKTAQEVFYAYKPLQAKPTAPNVIQAFNFLIHCEFRFFESFFFRPFFKEVTIKKVEQAYAKITASNVIFECVDACEFIQHIPVRRATDSKGMLIYADPPYPGTDTTHYNCTYTWDNLQTFVDTARKRTPFASVFVSLYENSEANHFATQNNLRKIIIAKNRLILNTHGQHKTEILLTNTENSQKIFSLF